MRGKLDVADIQLLAGWMQRRLQRCQTVVLQDVQQRGLSRIVQALQTRTRYILHYPRKEDIYQKQDFRILVDQAQR